MNDYAISLIRTWVPVGVGAVASWLLVHYSFHVDPKTQTGVTAFFTFVLTAAYYAVVRALEKKYPKFGVLLGHTAKPTYEKILTK